MLVWAVKLGPRATITPPVKAPIPAVCVPSKRIGPLTSSESPGPVMLQSALLAVRNWPVTVSACPPRLRCALPPVTST